MWTARKLASQGPGWLPRRLGYAARKAWADRVFPTRRMARHAALAGPSGATGDAPHWSWGPADLPAIVAAVPADRRTRTIGAADALLRREFTFRGVPAVTVAPGDWSPSSTSPDWICDLNRHHWFATLGFAYRYSGDPRYLREFIAQSSDWLTQHQDRLGHIAWDTPFEVASRLNAWLWAHFLFLSPEWDAAHHDRFLRGFGLLAEYLCQTIEFHSPGNHILLEAKTLALCGEMFPRFAGAARWRRKGWRMLNAELAAQIESDGVHVERSTMYHRIIAGELAELWWFCRRNDRPEAVAIGDTVRRMAGFETWIDQGAGTPPVWGDAHVEDSYARIAARAAVAAAEGAEARGLITLPTDHTFWLLGGHAPEAPPRPVEPMPGSRAFIAGGYFVSRSAWTDTADVLMWDCGPTGYARNRKHAHLDALAFTLSVGGTPMLIDPGTAESDARREVLRGTRAHSTVCIDGTEQGILAARSEIFSPPVAELRCWATAPECALMAGRHDGYRRLRDPVWHTRAILAMHGQYWLVADAIDGTGAHLVEQRFHVAPGVRVTRREEAGAVELRNDGVGLLLRWAPGGHPPEVRLESSAAELSCGRPEQTCTVVATRRGPVPMALTVVVARADRDVRVVPGEAGHWVITGPGFEDDVSVGSRARIVRSTADGARRVVLDADALGVS